MAIKQIASINSDNELLNRFMAEVQKVNTVLECPLLNGNLVKASLLASGATSVNHGLGRLPQGYILAGQSASSIVWQASVNKQVLNLNCSADVDVVLWVF